MKNILVPTDFSTCAISAGLMAIELARKSDAEIHFLHLMQTPVDWVKLPLEKEKQYPETKEKITHARNELNKLVQLAESKSIKAKAFLALDKGKEDIEEHIHTFGHDLLVMGSHGIKGIKEVIGSNTQKVIRYSEVPVLVVKKYAGEALPENIVFASHFDESYLGTFSKVLDIASLLKAKIHLLFVNTPDHFAATKVVEENMLPFINLGKGLVFESHVYDCEYEEKGILDFADTTSNSLIALATEGRHGLARIISPSLAEELVNHADIPVLVIPHRS